MWTQLRGEEAIRGEQQHHTRGAVVAAPSQGGAASCEGNDSMSKRGAAYRDAATQRHPGQDKTPAPRLGLACVLTTRR